MTDAKLIDLLVKPIGKWTMEQAIFVRDNRDRCTELMKTREFHVARHADFNERKVIPGEMAHAPIMDHVTYKSNKGKTVCTSAVIGYFNIPPSSYKYSGHMEQMIRVLNRHGWSCRSRMSATGVSPKRGQYPPLSAVSKNIRKLGEEGHYVVLLTVKGEGRHAILLDGKGKTVVDTAEGMTAGTDAVYSVYRVTRTKK